MNLCVAWRRRRLARMLAAVRCDYAPARSAAHHMEDPGCRSAVLRAGRREAVLSAGLFYSVHRRLAIVLSVVLVAVSATLGTWGIVTAPAPIGLGTLTTSSLILTGGLAMFWIVMLTTWLESTKPVVKWTAYLLFLSTVTLSVEPQPDGRPATTAASCALLVALVYHATTDMLTVWNRHLALRGLRSITLRPAELTVINLALLADALIGLRVRRPRELARAISACAHGLRHAIPAMGVAIGGDRIVMQKRADGVAAVLYRMQDRVADNCSPEVLAAIRSELVSYIGAAARDDWSTFETGTAVARWRSRWLLPATYYRPAGFIVLALAVTLLPGMAQYAAGATLLLAAIFSLVGGDKDSRDVMIETIRDMHAR